MKNDAYRTKTLYSKAGIFICQPLGQVLHQSNSITNLDLLDLLTNHNDTK